MKEGNVEGQGQQTLAQQPYFIANLGTNVTNIDTDGIVYDIVFTNEIADVGGNYDNTTGIFTAPVDGLYWFGLHLNLLDIDSAATFYDFRIYSRVSPLQSYSIMYVQQVSDLLSADTDMKIQGSCIQYLTAGQTAKCTRKQSGGTQQTDIDNGDSYFMGYLIA